MLNVSPRVCPCLQDFAAAVVLTLSPSLKPHLCNSCNVACASFEVLAVMTSVFKCIAEPLNQDTLYIANVLFSNCPNLHLKSTKSLSSTRSTLTLSVGASAIGGKGSKNENDRY